MLPDILAPTPAPTKFNPVAFVEIKPPSSKMLFNELVPDEPLEPDVPDEPELPDEPLEPDVPDEPELPDVPELPLVPEEPDPLPPPPEIVTVTVLPDILAVTPVPTKFSPVAFVAINVPSS